MIDAPQKSANPPKKFLKTTHSNQGDSSSLQNLSIMKTNSNHLGELEENTGNKVAVKKIKISNVSSRKFTKSGNILAEKSSSQRSLEVQEYNENLQ